MTRRLAIGGFLGFCAVALVWWLIREPSIPVELPTADEESGDEVRFVDPEPLEGARSDAGQEEERPALPSEAEGRRQVAEALREAIREARRARMGEATGEASEDEAEPSTSPAPGGGEASEEAEDEPAGTMDPEYIRDAMQAIQPLLAECYDLARAAAEREGAEAPEGRLVTRFVFTGEPEVGGVVEESEVLEESSLRDPALEECFRETLYTLELPAPDEGGTITVHYPFELSSDPDPDPEE